MKKAAIATAALVLAFLLPPVAGAELSAEGDLFVRFDGGIAPSALPRDSLAPIAVRIEGRIKSLSESPPAVRRIEVALNSAGRLETQGLPTCGRRQIRLATPSEALAACGPALVGGGGYTAQTTITDQTSSTSPGNILLFNSTQGGRPVTLGHVYQRRPFPFAAVIVFHIRRTSGTYGTVITAELPTSLGQNGYLRSIYLQLQRRYVAGGKKRAYLSAGCTAPQGFDGAVFPFARASMTFVDGRTLSASLTRTCRVR